MPRTPLSPTVVLVTILGLGACDGRRADAPPPEATAAPATAPAPAAAPAAAPPAPPPPPALPPVGERAETPVEGHLPVAAAAAVTRPAGARTLEIDGLIRFEAPPGVTVGRRPAVRLASSGATGFAAGEWADLSGLAPGVSVYRHNPAGDSGVDCPSLEAVRSRLVDAEILTDLRLSAPWSGEGPAYGDEIDLLVFRRAGQAGFYVRKRFDHGDDYTDLCAAFGGRDEPFAMTTLASLDQARAAAGILLTTRESH